MRIRHYGYNTFIIENDRVKIAIDPGIDLYWRKLNSLIPRSEWKGITHILVTHADPDHFAYAGRMARATGALVICGRPILEKGRLKRVARTQSLDPGETIDLKDFQVEGIKAAHGELVIKYRFFGAREYVYRPIKPGRLPEPGERIGLGAVGFKISMDNKVIANLGDTVLHREWEGLRPDVLMIPIGGKRVKNTMGEEEALEAVKLMRPKVVIPCHYNGDFLWIRNVNPTDVGFFKREVEKIGTRCLIMGYGDELGPAEVDAPNQSGRIG